MRVLSNCILVFCLFTTAACGALPDWVLNPVISDSELVAVGEGRTLQESEQSAVKNILGQLRTRISSRTMIAQQAVNNAFSETIEQSVDSQIENFPISQYQITQRHQEGTTIYTQARASKALLADAMVTEVNANFRQIDSLFASRKTGGSSLEWWIKNKEALFSSYAANERYLDILALLNYDTKQIKATASKNQNKINKTASETCLFVNATNPKKLQQALRKQVINVGLPADRSDCPFTLDVETSNEESTLFGRFTSSLTMSATLMQNGIALTSSEIIQTGQSGSGQHVANKASMTLLVKKLNADSAFLQSLLAN